MRTTIAISFLFCLFSFNDFAQTIYLPDGVSEYIPGDTAVTLRNGDGTLGQTYNKTLCGLNYEQASQMVTLRYSPDPGSGFPVTLSITTLSPSTVVETAYIY